MPYRFTLSAVLKLRESIEERDLHVLEQTQHEIAHTLHLLEILHDQERREIEVTERELAAGMSAVYLRIVEEARRKLWEHQHSLEKCLTELQLRRKQQLENYKAAKRGRQVLSDLRDRQREMYEAIAVRRQQRITDDLFLVRHQKR
ncbi:MAG: hypothetical protein WBS19_00620 [Candidatus Korobacteraceae bacterium]